MHECLKKPLGQSSNWRIFNKWSTCFPISNFIYNKKNQINKQNLPSTPKLQSETLFFINTKGFRKTQPYNFVHPKIFMVIQNLPQQILFRWIKAAAYNKCLLNQASTDYFWFRIKMFAFNSMLETRNRKYSNTLLLYFYVKTHTMESVIGIWIKLYM